VRTAATVARRRSARPGDRHRVRVAGRWSRLGAGGAPLVPGATYVARL